MVLPDSALSLDCRSCGACCAYSNDWPEFSDEDAVQMPYRAGSISRSDREWETYHFPNLHCDKDLEGLDRYASRPYLAAMVLGTTGWSGWNDTDSDYWQCRFNDLTDEGKALYRQMEALYPGCTLHLLTFLDT